jgi:hypothetical protein
LFNRRDCFSDWQDAIGESLWSMMNDVYHDGNTCPNPLTCDPSLHEGWILLGPINSPGLADLLAPRQITAEMRELLMGAPAGTVPTMARV